ncbi:hypothetical protein CDAR_569021 [Caerostris darwini]|uniref:ATP synthase F0 subunit 8 n=1 Tax=Caerostris darwini TaxID=1538125 RepID=A0AAV4Q9F0_9ARAC|nr:hypothetical protein CDAR_569021 [Caerostris darwini]
MKTFKFTLNIAFAISFWIWCFYQSVLYKNYSDTILLIPYVIVIQFTFKKITLKKKITFDRSQQTGLAIPEFTKIETSDSLTSTDDLKDYFSYAKDIALTNVNIPINNFIGYGTPNPKPFIPDTIPFITEHVQADSENISCSVKSVPAKGIIDALDGSNNAHLQSTKVNAKQKSSFNEQNLISYVNNSFQLSSNTSKSSIVLSVKKHAEIYEIDSEEEVTPLKGKDLTRIQGNLNLLKKFFLNGINSNAKGELNIKIFE